MKVPKTFLPERSLDKKIKQLIEYVPWPCDRKKGELREIFVNLAPPSRFEDNELYIVVRRSKHPEGFFMELFSYSEFYLPVSDNPIDWSPRIKKGEAKAFLKDEASLIRYFKDLEETNKAVLYWQADEGILELKDKFEKRYSKV